MSEIQTGYPSIDKPWLKYFKEEDLNDPMPECTVYESIYGNNKNFAKNTALNYFGHKISFEKLFLFVDKCTRSLRKIGIKRGDCVTLCTAGVPEAIYIVLACSRIGAIANFINPLFSKDQIRDRINETNADWIFILDEIYEYIEDSIPELCVNNVVIIPVTNSIPAIASKLLYMKSKARKLLKTVHNKTIFSYNEFAEMGADFTGDLDSPYEKDTPVVMVYSSGSTGASKGIQLTNDGINAIIHNHKRDIFYGRRSDTFLSMIPVWFSTGIVLSVLMPLAHGVCVIPEPQFNKETFAKDLKKYKPTAALTATSLWIHVCTAEETKDIDLSNMIYPATGGEKISKKDEVMINEFFHSHGCKVDLIKGYGMCELGSEVTGTIEAEGYKTKLGSAGYPILNSIVSTFDPVTNEELKYGEHGEIRVCSPSHMKGYYKNPEATSKYFRTDDKGITWGCTGDIGYVDEDGEVFVLGRATDSFKRENGETVYLFDIEDEIIEEQTINQCKVVDIKEDGKTKLVAHLVFKSGTSDTLSVIKKVDESLRNKLPGYMIPDYYKIREAMPVHPNGKRDSEALKNDREGFMTV